MFRLELIKDFGPLIFFENKVRFRSPKSHPQISNLRLRQTFLGILTDFGLRENSNFLLTLSNKKLSRKLYQFSYSFNNSTSQAGWRARLLYVALFY